MAALYVLDRRGAPRPARFDQITDRNEALCAEEPRIEGVDCAAVTADVVKRFRAGMSTAELDTEAAAACVARATQPGYEELAVRILVSDLHKRTPADYAAALAAAGPRVSPALRAVAAAPWAAAEIARAIDYSRDRRLSYFGYATLMRSYALRGESQERPQHVYMRVALGVHVVPAVQSDPVCEACECRKSPDWPCSDDCKNVSAAKCECDPVRDGGTLPDTAENRARLAEALAMYEALSLQRVSNATPTMLNAGTTMPQLSSCFQIAAADDLRAIFDTVTEAAMVSKWGGGVSVALHGVRAAGAPISSTGGKGRGLLPLLRILNEAQQYVDQGGKRPGAFAAYLSVDHADVFDFLAAPRRAAAAAGGAAGAAPDLKYGLWVSDDFMRAAEAQLAAPDDPASGAWHLFSPDEAPGLDRAHGAEYSALRARYVAEGRARRVVRAGDVLAEAFRTWASSGVPYVMFKDAVNARSNMSNVAPITSSNLCTEITLPCWRDADAGAYAGYHPGNGRGETGVCNLGAVCLASFLVPGTSPGALRLDYAGVAAAAALECRALNAVIDATTYPSPEGARSNRRHRPIGIGIMGYANVLARLGLAYGTPEARAVARAAAAAVYAGALGESARLAARDGPYETWAGSPASRGVIAPDMWAAGAAEGSPPTLPPGVAPPVAGARPAATGAAPVLGPDWEDEVAAESGGAITPATWAALRAAAARGLRNAYVTAYMPTATTSNIAGQNESFEPFTTNLYTRSTLAGEFVVVNRALVDELRAAGAWDDAMRREIVAAQGSVAGIGRVPAEVRKRYRTAREIPPSYLVATAAAMAPFVCQSMSLNAYFGEPSLPRILRFLFEAWRAGLKTGMYYCHTLPAAGALATAVRSSGGAVGGGGATTGEETSEESPGGAPGAACPLRAGPGECTACAL